MICTGFFIYLYGTDTAENVCQITVVLFIFAKARQTTTSKYCKPTLSLHKILGHHYVVNV